MPEIDATRLKADLSVFASHLEDDEARNELFISQLCRAVETELLNYYHSGDSSEGRFQRLAEISQMFREKDFQVGENHTISIGGTVYSCPTGTQCVDGNCVPVLGKVADTAEASS